MKSAIVLLACLAAFASANPQLLGLGLGGHLGLARLHDDGQWKPELDGSWLGSGALTWLGHDDGQWKPALDNSYAGLPLLHHRLRRSLLINPNSLPVPADTLHVALAKQAQLIQQNTEGTRNILGGGIPLALPADTHEVAIGKQAHAIAHARQTAITGHGIAALHAPLAAVAAPLAAPLAAVHSPLALRSTLGLGLGLGHGWW